MLFTQTANVRSMRLAAKLGFTEVERFEAYGAEQWFGDVVPGHAVRLSSQAGPASAVHVGSRASAGHSGEWPAETGPAGQAGARARLDGGPQPSPDPGWIGGRPVHGPGWISCGW